jgi:YfiH family protein
VSAGPYASLNLGDHVGDAAEAVSANRRIFAAALRARPVFMQQVHGSRVAHLSSATADGVQADACVTTEPGIACTIMVADCLPVLFATADGKAVAAAHAGWRGLAGPHGQGVLEAACRALSTASGAGAAETLAWLGPCIGPRAFEVGPEVKDIFVARLARAEDAFRPGKGDRLFADIYRLARLELAQAGVQAVYGGGLCTVGQAGLFHSFRRDGRTGRMASLIWRTANPSMSPDQG